MEIALLNVKVTFQKNSVAADDIGNRRNVWEDYYTCHATVSGEGGGEKAAAGLTVVDSDIAFTIRFCKRAAEVTADGFRILFGGETYNIVAVDHMNYRKKTLKFRCEHGTERTDRDLADAIMETLEEYADLAADNVNQAVKDAGETVKKEIRANARRIPGIMRKAGR